ncbi:hypothetical protein GUITHDRAFT_145129 [Guillardia theta CCMP2712]|uniref:PRELI/MSF1 domain-containing protein n=1 Tax=Guillardia theta (strain CCMP2712) TaxID=905079 RepID=L1IMK7_GUITC|nr:hypothetical protein GUITHDRAFT_145129 [Guillardia theta CCMP2712]EKX37312.1 hypothetical protein GUITHDRAFT_145129 [Guillardia theta CCMP2712]|eukprot:XP_005824292.1 hypothetical protein GUITHDRAFT_145129 [Guillardia theta CCMP2712]
MPTTQEHQGVYPKSWSMVTAFLWDKYNGHAWVRDVDVIDRHIDVQGRLHSRRLLTLYSKTPFVLRPILGASVRPFYLLEDSVVDLENRTMEVNVCNVNLRNICFCKSESSYTPDADNPSYTRYGIMVQTRAFPKEISSTSSSSSSSSSSSCSLQNPDMAENSSPRFQAIHR